MRGLGVFGTQDDDDLPDVFDADSGSRNASGGLVVDGMPVRASLVSLAEPRFDGLSDRDAHAVLVEVSAFSCNYRDKGMFRSLTQVPRRRFKVIGSEFAGTVLAVGRSVTRVRPDDHVIGQNAYVPSATRSRTGVGGLPTNGASREMMVLGEHAVAVVPESMSPVVGAAFAVGAQTAFAMVRRANLEAGAVALVMSAASNTSLSLITALRLAGVTVVAATSSLLHVEAIRALGVADVIVTEPGVLEPADAALIALAVQAHGPISAVFDPYFDLHVERSVELLAPGGSYLTCGYAAQNPGAAERGGVVPVNAEAVLRAAILKNLTLVGNCLGEHADLTRALEAHRAGLLPVVLDSVHAGSDVAGFLARTFTDPDRFGKVVFAYDTSWR